VTLQPAVVQHNVVVEQEDAVPEAVVAGQKMEVVQSLAICVSQALIKSVKIQIFNHLN
jgi:hypothetical protein